MSDLKSILLSKTVWGAMLAVAATALSLFGIELADSVGFANEIVVLIGSGLAIYGRVKAVKKIG